MIRVALVDDQELVRAGVRRILQTHAGIEVVGEADDGDGATALVDATSPDVVLMDMRMKRVDGVEATQRIHAAHPDTKVIVLTTFDDDDTLSAALRCGAVGFLLKDAPGEDIVRAVVEVAGGGAWLDPSVTARVLASYRAPAPSPPPDDLPDALTPRELEVLRLVARGATNREIAEALHVGEVTVKTHISRIFMKLAVRDRAAAIVYAFDHGIATAGDHA